MLETRESILKGVLAVSFFVLIGLYAIFQGERILYYRACFSSSEGVHGQGVIDGKSHWRGRKSSRDYIKFHFSTGTSTERTEVEVYSGIWSRYLVGSSVPVVYLRDDPKISGLYLPEEYSAEAHYAWVNMSIGIYTFGLLAFGFWWKSRRSLKGNVSVTPNPTVHAWQKADVPEQRHG